MIAALRAALFGILLIATATTAAAPPAGACACGIAIDAELSRERALVIQRGAEEQIVASFHLDTAEGGRAAVVLPVPGDPSVEAIEEGDPLAYLDRATLAQADPNAPDAAAGAGPSTRRVDVIGREIVGGYDVSRLAADDPQALDRWLADNGYDLPRGAERILDGYVADGWRFVAIRLAPGDEGQLKPLSVSFPTEELVYPVRLNQLADAPVDLTLYVLAAEPQRAGGLAVAYEGPVDELEPPVPPELEGLLGVAPQLTKLTLSGIDPAQFVEDLTIQPASAVPTDATGGGNETVAAEDDGGVSTVLIVAAVLAWIVLLTTAAMLWRRRGSAS